jgi:trehalose-6-phosphate synthase
LSISLLDGELVNVVLTAEMIGFEEELDRVHFVGCVTMILEAGCCDNVTVQQKLDEMIDSGKVYWRRKVLQQKKKKLIVHP